MGVAAEKPLVLTSLEAFYPAACQNPRRPPYQVVASAKTDRRKANLCKCRHGSDTGIPLLVMSKLFSPGRPGL